uniref:15-oxoprostaglandin 13-reductase n=2 Tax=Arion vulgaris TaxID=1028688 RepID=A0A0B7BMB1_9EUPU
MSIHRIPSKMRQILVKKLASNFREATEIVEAAVPKPGPKEVVIKNRYVGINASDINYTAGRYDPTKRPPFPAGFEGLGEVVSVGPDTVLKVGQAVLYSKFGAFSDFISVEAATTIPVPTCDPAFLSLMVSGLTASVALEKEADLKPGQTVLVTAAAGGTGQFAVQLAKLAGCHVIGTCSSDDKNDFLKSIGCDRTINYRKEKLNDVLSKEYPKGVDVVYESVGNEMFDDALKNLAVFGKLIVIGMISNYEGQEIKDGNTFHDLKEKRTVPIPMTVLTKSARVSGFFLPHYRADFPRHIGTLIKLYKEGKLKVSSDVGVGAANGPFVGLEKVADAVEHMYARKNVGKVIVELNKDDKSAL